MVYQDDDPHQESFGEAIGEIMIKSADWLGQQAFSRSNEYQADATSWDMLVQSRKYNPQASRSLLNKLWENNGKRVGLHHGKVLIQAHWIGLGHWIKIGVLYPIETEKSSNIRCGSKHELKASN